MWHLAGRGDQGKDQGMAESPRESGRQVGHGAGDAVDADQGERRQAADVQAVEIETEETDRRPQEDPFSETEDLAEVTPIEGEPVARLGHQEAAGDPQQRSQEVRHQDRPDRGTQPHQQQQDRRARDVQDEVEQGQGPQLQAALQQVKRGRGRAEDRQGEGTDLNRRLRQIVGLRQGPGEDAAQSEQEQAAQHLQRPGRVVEARLISARIVHDVLAEADIG